MNRPKVGFIIWENTRLTDTEEMMWGVKAAAAFSEGDIPAMDEYKQKQLDNARRDYENRIEELRMQGAAKDLQIRMKKIEEQLRLMQKLTSVDIELADMPTDEEIEQLAAREEEERRTKLEAEKKSEDRK